VTVERVIGMSIARTPAPERRRGETWRMIETPFTSLSPAVSRALVDASRLREVAAGDRIFSEGEVGGSVFLVSSGLVAVEMTDADQRPVTVALRGPGEILGEMSLFAKARKRTATTTARARARLLELDADAAARVRGEHRELDDLFLRILAERSAALSRRFAERGSISAKTLVIRTMLELPVGPNADAPIPATIADLAGICGLSSDEVTRIMETLESDELIHTQGSDGIKITDRSAMTHRASVL
jgi:CRP-like cAMP-binding protein